MGCLGVLLENFPLHVEEAVLIVACGISTFPLSEEADNVGGGTEGEEEVYDVRQTSLIQAGWTEEDPGSFCVEPLT